MPTSNAAWDPGPSSKRVGPAPGLSDISPDDVCEENETYPTLQKYPAPVAHQSQPQNIPTSLSPEISRNQRWLESSPRLSMDDFSMKHGWIMMDSSHVCLLHWMCGSKSHKNHTRKTVGPPNGQPRL